MISLKINNEYAQLKTVVLGIAKDFGGTPKLQHCYDPKSREHVDSNVGTCMCFSGLKILAVSAMNFTPATIKCSVLQVLPYFAISRESPTNPPQVSVISCIKGST